MLLAPRASAQASAHPVPMVAIGRVDASGVLTNSANTERATVDCFRNGPGSYTITLGTAFSDPIENYLAEVTCDQTDSGDLVPKIRVDSVKDGVLTLLVHIDDVEHGSDPGVSDPADSPFFFSVYQMFGPKFPVRPSRYLIAAGKVTDTGILRTNPRGLDGITVTTAANGVGDYNVTLSKTDGFAGSDPSDYVIMLTLSGSGVQDHAIRGGVTNLLPDSVTFNVHTDDVQDPADDDAPVPDNKTFHFTIYRIPPGETGLARSSMLMALGKVYATGELIHGSAYGDATLTTTMESIGNYLVTVTLPGAFKNKEVNQYIPQVFLNENTSRSQAIEGEISLSANGDTLRLRVGVNNVETPIQTTTGNPAGAPFSFLIFDSEPVVRPDLMIGTKNQLVRNQIGNNIYNAGGRNQRVDVRLRGTRKEKYYFTLENDGNTTDDIFLKAKRSGNRIEATYFRITGGRQNITAAIESGGFVEDNVVPQPQKEIRYEVQVKYGKRKRQPSKTLRYLARSEFVPGILDINKVKLAPK